MFLNKIRNIFCVPDTKFVSATNVARALNGETFVSATMCPQQCVLVCQGLYLKLPNVSLRIPRIAELLSPRCGVLPGFPCNGAEIGIRDLSLRDFLVFKLFQLW